WELPPLSVRNSVNGLLWIGGLALFVTLSGSIHGAIGRSDWDIAASLLVAPLSAVFLCWSGWVLTAKRVPWRELLPFSGLGAVLLAAYSIGATVYVPRLFSTYATRYGVIGAVCAMISTFFVVMLILVVSSAAGREIQV